MEISDGVLPLENVMVPAAIGGHGASEAAEDALERARQCQIENRGAEELLVELEQETQRTWVLDGVNVLLLGGFPLVPWWGDVFLNLTARISGPSGKDATTYAYEIQSPFSAMAFGWYRRGYVERAYQRAFQEAFRRLAVDIARDAPTLALVARGGTPSEGRLPPVDSEGLPEPPSEEEAEMLAALDAMEEELEPVPDEDNIVFLEPIGFHVIRGDEAPESEAGLWGYLKLLGGVEASVFGGLAHVSSNALNQDGENE